MAGAAVRATPALPTVTDELAGRLYLDRDWLQELVDLLQDRRQVESASSGYPNEDVYQMLAYCTALGLRVGWLVYARGAQPPEPRRVRHTDIDIVHRAVDLSAPPRELLARMSALADEALPAASTHGVAGFRGGHV